MYVPIDATIYNHKHVLKISLSRVAGDFVLLIYGIQVSIDAPWPYHAGKKKPTRDALASLSNPKKFINKMKFVTHNMD